MATVDITSTISTLRDHFGERLSTSQALRETHGKGEGFHSDDQLPDAVVFAHTTDDVAFTVQQCAATRTPIIPFGVGTSLEGQIAAVRGGISLDLSQMDKVLSVSADDLDCRVEAGVTREALNAAIRDQGLFFPLDPGANASLGGMASTRASGTNAVRYGTMRELTLGLTVVQADGSVIRTGGRARKSSAGYDLTKLFVGSEGTLGIVTELQVRLFGIPETISAAVCQFETLRGATTAVMQAMQIGVPLARIELLDEMQMKACIAYSKLENLAEAPTLFLEFHGAPNAVAEQIETMRELAEANGGGAFGWASTQEERTKLWTARHNAYWAARALAPGKDSFATDACVPISHLAEVIDACRARAAESGLISPVTGHVGDGNFHLLVLFDRHDNGERERAERLVQDVAEISLQHGGTITGEHGIGLHKRNLMLAEHGHAIATMRAIKHALDPHDIMNPGKILPDDIGLEP
jgi:D-lactate dehydrogenase (cytochrome)